MVTTDRQSGNPYMSGKLLYCIDPLNERYLIAYDLQEIDSEEGAPKQYTYLTEVFDHRPSLHEVAEVIYRPYNDLCDDRVLRGFSYTTLEDTPVTRHVWLVILTVGLHLTQDSFERIRVTTLRSQRVHVLPYLGISGFLLV